MTMGSLRLALAGAVVLALPASAAAEPTPDRWQFDGFFGGHFFSENNELGARDVEDAPHPANSIAFGLRLGYWIVPALALEIEGIGMPTEVEDGNSEQFIAGYRLNALYQFDLGKVKPFVLIGAGGMSNSSERDETLLDDTDFVAHAGIGARFAISDSVGVRVDGRWLLPPSSASEGVTSDFEALIGIYKTFGGSDEPAPEPEPEPTDEDGDGIVGDADQCPTEAEDPDGFQDEDGCPDPDNDGDGIADADDQCPNEAETMNGIDDTDGCPEGDEDGDGLVGSADQCPAEPEDKDGHQDEDGCPDPDNDGDGVADADDKCPTELETMNGYQDGDGCPDEVPKEVKKFTGVIKGINFKVNSADLTRASFRTLDRALKIFQEYPDLRVEIAGHTDDTGSAEYNRDLSQRRAETVKDYFVSKGIAEERLIARGYGPDKPIDPRKTKAARAKNRRVEFTLLTGAQTSPQDGAGTQPTPPEGGGQDGADAGGEGGEGDKAEPGANP